MEKEDVNIGVSSPLEGHRDIMARGENKFMEDNGVNKSYTGFSFIDNTDSDFIKYYTRMMKPPFNLSKHEMELYSIMHNRWTLSKYKAFDGDKRYLDENGDFYFTLERDQVVKYIGVNKGKFPALKKKLVDLGLLREAVKRGHPTRYYLIKEYDDYGGVKEIIDSFEGKDN